MSAKKKMTTKNNVEDATMLPNERILKAITELYTSGTSGGGARLSTVAIRHIGDSPCVPTRRHAGRHARDDSQPVVAWILGRPLTWLYGWGWAVGTARRGRGVGFEGGL